MEPIIVRRHGDRWAVQESEATAPAQEYDTRELAEVAARQLAGETREIRMIEDTGDEPLGQVREPDVEDARPSQGDVGVHERTGGAAIGTEMPREPQSGL